MCEDGACKQCKYSLDYIQSNDSPTNISDHVLQTGLKQNTSLVMKIIARSRFISLILKYIPEAQRSEESCGTL